MNTSPKYQAIMGSSKWRLFDNLCTFESIPQSTKKPLVAILKECIHSDEHTDVDVIVERDLFRCNSLLLKEFCGYFEEIVDRKTQILLPETTISSQNFKTLYQWIMKNEFIHKRSTIMNLFRVSEKLKIPDLAISVWSCLTNENYYNEMIAFQGYCEASKRKSFPLQMAMARKISKCFLSILTMVEFYLLELTDVRILLGLNNIAVNMEIEVFYAGILWLHFDFEKRKPFIICIMELIRFGHMSPPFLINLLVNVTDQLVKCCITDEVRDLIMIGIHSRGYKVQERRWIRDNACPYKNYTPDKLSLEEFTKYLSILQKLGARHWKQFEYCERPVDARSDTQKITESGDDASWISLSVKSNNTLN